MFFSYFAATVLAVTATTEAQTIVLDDTQRAQWCKTIEEVVIPDMEQGEEQQRIRLLNLYTDNKKLSRQPAFSPLVW